ncbi:ATP-dependent DNA ligase [Allosphingosinicella vermicomposti]|uniref:ATP-dependent DNA ligase n=1 Tax=Allosphingosinicella vermicomposti TaxID=614671 RepID=UPI000D0FF3AA|nr:ATP-dependent DNA ligase [Allosphingosinicella vermicomposti]
MADFRHLKVKPGIESMEAKLVDSLPVDAEWHYEPKWDGFRCLVFRDDDAIMLQSKSGKPLGRYFPEVVEAVRALRTRQIVLDGELVICADGALSFEALQMRLHPAESRIRKLASQTPARMVLFDCLEIGGQSLISRSLTERRQALDGFFGAEKGHGFDLSPYTLDTKDAQAWLDHTGGALDGVMTKRRNDPYMPGERAMLKVKQLRSADCVVGGFRYGTGSNEVGSLLLGLYNDDGLLDHVGFTSSIPNKDKPALTRQLEALVEAPGFTGRAPGGPSRWSTERSADWQPLRSELIAEVRYDHVTGDRFRHGTKLLRWRPDKAPAQCRMEQLKPEAPPAEIARLLKTV